MVYILSAAAALLFGFTLVVSVQYWQKWRRSDKRSGLLPLHAWTVALSYDLLLLSVVFQGMVLVRWWHWWLFIPALALGIFAMYVISTLQTNRKR